MLVCDIVESFAQTGIHGKDLIGELAHIWQLSNGEIFTHTEHKMQQNEAINKSGMGEKVRGYLPYSLSVFAFPTLE